MPTIATVAQDRPFIVGVASTYTLYPDYRAAKAAAVALSAANASAPVYTGKIHSAVTAATAPALGRVDVVPGFPTAWIIQLASTTTYLPRNLATSTAFSTSASNANAPVYVARTFQTCVGP